MSPTWARMPVRSALGSFLHRLHEIVERLEFADELGLQQPRHRLADVFATMERLLADLYAECSKQGSEGARVYASVNMIYDQLKACWRAHDEGDLEPWRLARGCIVNDLHALRRLLQPQLNATGITGPARSSAVIGKGCTEGGESTLPEIPWNATRVLELLLRDGAIKQGDRLTREYIAEETRLSSAQIRRAIENDLKPRSLVCSKPGRGGGVWMSTEGIAVARRTAAGNRRA